MTLAHRIQLRPTVQQARYFSTGEEVFAPKPLPKAQAGLKAVEPKVGPRAAGIEGSTLGMRLEG